MGGPSTVSVPRSPTRASPAATSDLSGGAGSAPVGGLRWARRSPRSGPPQGAPTMAEQFIRYAPDQPFPGTIGRTLETSTPAWPSRPEPPAGAPNVVVIVLDDVGYGQLSAVRRPVRDPQPGPPGGQRAPLRQLPDHRPVLTHPGLPAHRTQPPRPGAGRHHRAVARLPVPRRHHGLRARLRLRDPGGAGLQHLRRGQVAPDPPARRRPRPGPFNRWPLGRGFERFYGFMGGDTDQFHPDLVHDNHSVRQPAHPGRGLPPQRRHRRPRHRLHRRRPHHAPRTSRSSSGTPPVPATLPTRSSRSGSSGTHGAFDMGWDEYRRIVFDRQRAFGLLAPGAELSLRDPDVEPWD